MFSAKLNEGVKYFITTINSYFPEGIAGKGIKEIYINNNGFCYDPQPAKIIPQSCNNLSH